MTTACSGQTAPANRASIKPLRRGDRETRALREQAAAGGIGADFYGFSARRLKTGADTPLVIQARNPGGLAFRLHEQLVGCGSFVRLCRIEGDAIEARVGGCLHDQVELLQPTTSVVERYGIADAFE